ncbi:MAG: hypothetical protein KH369_15920 [Paraclostridium bifermentans]|uniref:hypothetical protein n=1 Tax=Paraclostridium bifermentans TaxID=1490 RepID=UPI001D41D923|nr:hypothetical protein [Paraclostridium bifermentans]MBS6509689.1 hypothetical protein [Paraclostridium bifermentans]
MISIEGVKINENNVTHIRVTKKGIPVPPNREDDRVWTIRVEFINGSYIYIGDYSTKGYAQDRLNENI